jgi:hypothetical protein
MHTLAPASEPKLTNPTKVQDAIRGLKVGKAPGPDGIPNRALKHLPLSVVSLLVVLFNAILRTQYFPAVWKHARVLSTMKPGKDPALPSSHRPISLLDRLANCSRKSHSPGFSANLVDADYCAMSTLDSGPNSTALQLARLVERVSRNFDGKRLTGPVLLDVAKAFDTVWIDGLLYKLSILNFPSYLVKTIYSFLKGRSFEASFQTATATSRMRAGVAQGGII